MLDCCTDLEDVKQKGITLDDFVCLARCQGVTADAIRAPSTMTDETKNTTTPLEKTSSGDCKCMAVSKADSNNGELQLFREVVQSVASGRGERLLVVSYDRKVLGQTGSGHFRLVRYILDWR
jgi:glutathione gamma-glutamylcysteinyltransferase